MKSQGKRVWRRIGRRLVAEVSQPEKILQKMKRIRYIKVCYPFSYSFFERSHNLKISLIV